MADSERYVDFDQVSVAAYLIVIWKSKGFLFAFSTIAVASALVFSVLSPKSFESTVTLLPPSEGDSAPGLSTLALRGQLSTLGLGGPAASKQDVLLNVLDSRTLAETLVEKYQLATYYKVVGIRQAVEQLRAASKASVSKASLILVTVADRDPRMAAELANAHAVELNKFLSQMDNTKNSRRRRFLLDRLTETERELQGSEQKLMRFQEKNSAVALQEQAQGAIDVAAQLKGQIMAAEVELQMTRNFATEFNPDVVVLRRKIEELKKQMARMQYGTGLDLPFIGASTGEVGSTQKEIHLAAANVPRLGLQFARLTRDLKVQETVYILLTQQLEEVKIAEARDVLAARVLDPAVPALWKSRPKTVLNMALAGVLSLVLGICFVFIRESLDGKRPEPEPTGN